ncbi:MAG: gas vesicle protein GvpD P-loop domain-containing protein, partial [Candidatus Jordarchaeaceae archaeon]
MYIMEWIVTSYSVEINLLSIKKSIPTEIINLLERGSHSLHIKGSAGTGKTTLALEIAKNMSSKGDAIYLSTRVSP